MTRGDLTKEAAAEVFADDVSEFVGPVESEGKYWVYHILLPKRAELNKNVYVICEDLIVQELLRQKHTEMLAKISR